MIEKHLGLIRQKEAEGKARLKEAEIRAAQTIERARQAGEKAFGEALVQTDEHERSLMAAARRSADEKISVLRAENAKKLAVLVVVSKKNQDKAIEMIVKEFCGGA